MATPLKSTLRLSAKVSPLSPKFLSPTNFNRTCIENTVVRPKTVIKIRNLKLVENVHPVINNVAIKLNLSDGPKQDLETKKADYLNTLLKNKFSINNSSSILGKGTFGTVIKGKYQDKDAAIKIVKLKPNMQLNEINSLNFCHKNVIKIYDINYVNINYGLIIMEYTKNSQNFQDILNNSSFILNVRNVLKYAHNIVDGLHYCHVNNILHLDLKPKNILLFDNICKICDFGNSFNMNSDQQNYKFNGTIAYAAPEILMGKPPTYKSDVYSLGILLWQLKSHRNPYEFIENEVIIYKVVKFNLRPDFVDGCENEDEFSKLYNSCWQADPCNRPQIVDIQQVLKNLIFLNEGN